MTQLSSATTSPPIGMAAAASALFRPDDVLFDTDLDANSALGGVKGCSHLGDLIPEERKRCPLELAHENVRR